MIRVEPQGWGEYLNSLIVKLDPFCGVEPIRREIEAGRMSAWLVVVENIKIGCFITRVDNRYDGEKDLALLFTIADNNAKEAISKVMYELLEQVARASGAKYIRIHIDNPALARIVGRAGFNFLESVYIKAVDDVIKK